MAWENFLIPILVLGVVGIFAVSISLSQGLGVVCPIEPCQENFSAQFKLDSREQVNTFSVRKITQTIDQNCTVPNGTYRQVACNFDRNFVVVTTSETIEPIGVRKNTLSLTQLNEQTHIIVPDPLEQFADPNSIYEANCWATQNGRDSFDLNSPSRTRNTLTDTVFSESNRAFACDNIIEIQ